MPLPHPIVFKCSRLLIYKGPKLHCHVHAHHIFSWKNVPTTMTFYQSYWTSSIQGHSEANPTTSLEIKPPTSMTNYKKTTQKFTLPLQLYEELSHTYIALVGIPRSTHILHCWSCPLTPPFLCSPSGYLIRIVEIILFL